MKRICPVTGCLSLVVVALLALLTVGIALEIQAERERPAVTYVEYVSDRAL